jgi:hypothetical protein
MQLDSPSPALIPDNARHDLFDWIDMFIKAASLSVGLWAAFLAIGAYQKDINEKIVDQRIKAFNDALEAAGKVALARDWETYDRAIDEFGAVKHGEVLQQCRRRLEQSSARRRNTARGAWRRI